jgi:aldehyde dehydrogenase (NAD+)
MTTSTPKSHSADVLDSLGLSEMNSGAFCGRWLDSKGPELASIDPNSGEILARVQTATAEDY